jgi:hypothetical protein
MVSMTIDAIEMGKMGSENKWMHATKRKKTLKISRFLMKY